LTPYIFLKINWILSHERNSMDKLILKGFGFSKIGFSKINFERS
jgi:hypothetical protein